jgi:superfamily I DNA/RNA helicase
MNELHLAMTGAGIETRVLADGDRRHLGLGEPNVKLLTLHGAKGLDFPIVFVALDGSGLKWSDDEQRRLVYVGMTRAGYALTLVTPVDDVPPVLAELDIDETVRVSGPVAEEGRLALRRLRRGDSTGV